MAGEQVRCAQAEAGELRAALAAAALKQREAEALVGDFTSVVQQQKEAIRGLQRDKEALQVRALTHGLTPGCCLRSAAAAVDPCIPAGLRVGREFGD